MMFPKEVAVALLIIAAIVLQFLTVIVGSNAGDGPQWFFGAATLSALSLGMIAAATAIGLLGAT